MVIEINEGWKEKGSNYEPTIEMKASRKINHTI